VNYPGFDATQKSAVFGMFCGKMSPPPLRKEETPSSKLTLLLIDVQNDFHAGGSLAIPGADADTVRIASFIRNHMCQIDRIIATLDSHYKLHIAHPSFWISGEDTENGSDLIHPQPFTIITSDEIKTGRWMPRSDINVKAYDASSIDLDIFDCDDDLVDAETGNINMALYCYHYAKKLETAGRFNICIWPEHCCIGSTGHAVVNNIYQALNEWTEQTGKTVEWVMKGQNLFTEMYSALAAEVPVSKDTSYNTSLQQSLLLGGSEVLIVCGQAMSHCVNYTVRDIVRGWDPSTSPLRRIYVLEDCASAVPGFSEAAQCFRSDMLQVGVQFKNSTDPYLW
jgi:nicotinamidase/pyrazinamidase